MTAWSSAAPIVPNKSLTPFSKSASQAPLTSDPCMRDFQRQDGIDEQCETAIDFNQRIAW